METALLSGSSQLALRVLTEVETRITLPGAIKNHPSGGYQESPCRGLSRITLPGAIKNHPAGGYQESPCRGLSTNFQIAAGIDSG
ncbi:MAG: hypothetical protein NTV33_02690 [Coprothermobacterota bacterium]|nr:hypothetical protein [Coprothermobacterota bacterium]